MIVPLWAASAVVVWCRGLEADVVLVGLWCCVLLPYSLLLSAAVVRWVSAVSIKLR